MGAGMCAEIGRESLYEDNKCELEEMKARLRDNDETFVLVDCANRYIGDAPLCANVRCLVGNTNVLRLDLSYNKLTARCLPVLIEVLKGCPQLLSFSLAGNRIGEEGCEAIGRYLATNPALEELSLFHNDLYDPAAVPLVNGLLSNSSLAVLNLDLNNFTNATWVMLHLLIVKDGQKGLVCLTVGMKYGYTPSRRVIEEIAECLAVNRQTYDECKREQAWFEREERDRLLREERERQFALESDEQRRLEEEKAEQYQGKAEQHQEEAEAHRFQSELGTGSGKHGNNRRPFETPEERERRLESERRSWVERAMRQAYEWRDKITCHGTLVKEWRDGFTTVCTRPGEPLGTTPSVTVGEIPRLKACWCDPRDFAAPFAKILHYHCKYEGGNKAYESSQWAAASEGGATHHYEGCKQTAHRCASLGFYAKPLPDRSPAHFFSSPAKTTGVSD